MKQEYQPRTHCRQGRDQQSERSGLYLDTAQVMTLSTMLIDKMHLVNCVNSDNHIATSYKLFKLPLVGM